MFTDVQGSTAQWESNPEIMTLALDMHFKIMREHMNRSGGYPLLLTFLLILQSLFYYYSYCTILLQNYLPQVVFFIFVPLFPYSLSSFSISIPISNNPFDGKRDMSARQKEMPS